jgi:ADP-ribosylglycohydrolase
MLGAICGDIVGSCYEGLPMKSTAFPLFSPDSRFTDDTVLTAAVADWILTGSDLVDLFHTYFVLYPHAGYGGSFYRWAKCRNRQPYNSWGNGAAMRVSPVGWAAKSIEEAAQLATKSAAVTHDHPDGVSGAVAVAIAVFLARTGASKEEIRQKVMHRCGYNLTRSVADIRPNYAFDVSSSRSVPESIIAFLDSSDFESAIRNAVSLGGDADTMACIAGSIAEPFYGGIPKAIYDATMMRLDPRIVRVVSQFYATLIPQVPATA